MTAVAFDTLKLARSLRDQAQMTPLQSEGIATALAEAMSGAELSTKADIEGLRTEMSVQKTDTATLKTDVAILKTDVATLKTDVAILKTDVAILKTDVATLKTDVAILKADVATLKTDVATLKTDVTDLKADVATLKTDVAGIKIDLTVLGERIERRAAESEARMVRWVVGTGVAAVIAIVGTFIALFRTLPLPH
jgi:chromosome segregation ATPase